MTDPVARLSAALQGRYAIERELGEGGMATVYLADDLKGGGVEAASGELRLGYIRSEITVEITCLGHPGLDTARSAQVAVVVDSRVPARWPR